MTNEPHWLMRIHGGLSAHFFQPDGSSRPGTDWAVGLKRGESTYNVTVRAYLSEDATKRTRADTKYQGQTVLGYLSDLLAEGWRPDQGGALVIVIQNPRGGNEEQRGKRWWRFW